MFDEFFEDLESINKDMEQRYGLNKTTEHTIECIYVIKQGNKYIVESDVSGVSYTTDKLDNATPFPSIDNAQFYIEHDMKCNVTNYDIVRVSYIIKEEAV